MLKGHYTDLFSYDIYHSFVSVVLKNENRKGGRASFGGPSVDIAKISFVAEIADGEGQPWSEESSPNLLKLAHSINGQIRVRELTKEEQKIVDEIADSFEKDPTGKLPYGHRSVQNLNLDLFKPED